MARCWVSLSRLKVGGWYCIVLGPGFLERMSSGWHDVLAVGGDLLVSGGVGPVSFVYQKACLIAAS